MKCDLVLGKDRSITLEVQPETDVESIALSAWSRAYNYEEHSDTPGATVAFLLIGAKRFSCENKSPE